MLIKEALTFDDVLLEPKFSEISSRANVNLSVKIKNFYFKLPFIPANMQSIIGKEMIEAMYSVDALSIMHRFDSLENQAKLINDLVFKYGHRILDYLAVSVGVSEQDYKNLNIFHQLGIKIFCIDIAHLDSTKGLEMIRFISSNYPKSLLIAGNVATAEGAERAWRAGADVVKVGIGSSGICTTRLEAGAGVPQLTAIINVAKRKLSLSKELDRKLYLISDGGHRKSADCVKALCFADMVMLGGILAGSDETPGRIIQENNFKYKEYSGSSTHKKDRVEGIKALVKAKGPVLDIIKKLSEGLQSGCSYQNCNNLKELKQDPILVKITSSSILESQIHDIDKLIQ